MGKPSVMYRLRFLLIRVTTGNFLHFVLVFSPSKEKKLTDPIYALVHSTHFHFKTRADLSISSCLLVQRRLRFLSQFRE